MMSGKMYRFRVPTEYVDARFVVFYLQTARAWADIDRMKTGGSDSGLNLTHARFRKLQIPVAPIAEQRRVVAAIEEQLSRLDAGVAALERLRQNVKRMRAAVLYAAVTGKLSAEEALSVEGLASDERASRSWLNATNVRKVQRAAADLLPLTWDIPGRWTWKSAYAICEMITSGSTPAKATMTAGHGDVPYIKVYNLTHSGKLDFSIRPTFIDRATHEGQLRRSRLFPGDVLTNIVGPPLGKVSVVPNGYPEWNTNQAVVVFRVSSFVHPRLLRYWLLSPPVLKMLASTSRATAGQFNISLTTCRALPLPIPPRDQQDTLVAAIDDCFSVLDVIEESVNHMASSSARLRSLILAAAYSGKLVPQDPDDEPASVLLQRIATGRGPSSGHKPRSIRRKVPA
jgi:type I restriction enzyme S subunit